MNSSNNFRLTWLTDIHINKLELPQRQHLYDEIKQQHSDAIAISGDIAEPDSVCTLLYEMASHCSIPVHFVLGNHDYHLELLSTVRNRISQLCNSCNHLHWLPHSHRWLTQTTALTGIDGWADARHGDYTNSSMHQGDHRMALDFNHFKHLGKFALQQKMQQVADNEAAQLQQQLHAIQQSGNAKRIIVITHFPPFKEASFFNGKPSQPKHLPFYTSKATGNVLSQFALQHPDIEITALCGHTHSAAYHKALPNLEVFTGKADYGSADIQRVFDLTHHHKAA